MCAMENFSFQLRGESSRTLLTCWLRRRDPARKRSVALRESDSTTKSTLMVRCSLSILSKSTLIDKPKCFGNLSSAPKGSTIAFPIGQVYVNQFTDLLPLLPLPSEKSKVVPERHPTQSSAERERESGRGTLKLEKWRVGWEWNSAPPQALCLVTLAARPTLPIWCSWLPRRSVRGTLLRQYYRLGEYYILIPN